MRSSPLKTFAGILLVALGALFMLGQVGLVDADYVLQRTWPLPIILYGGLLWLASPARVVVPAIVVVSGLVLLATTLDFVPGSALAYVWPLALIAVGAWILLNRVSTRQRIGDDLDSLDSFVIFGTIETRSRSQHFRGGSAVSMFGEIKLDLREAQPTSEGATLDATALFGALSIRVPKELRVEVNGAPIFGSINNQAIADGSPSEDAPTLKVDALALFGEVKIDR